MSAVYNLEPQPTAQVLLTTTSGDILLELFAKQTPITSRNFLQLCLDGYYDNTIFHRLVPSFIIQGGDPTGTGEGGEAIYPGGLFEDEFHSRLKFNRRGLLGMANSGRKNDNGSQFFLTLGVTPELEGKNTMFGRVAGDTIYNLMKMGEAELAGGEGNERPLYPTKVTGSTVLVNPFEGMIKREEKVRVAAKEADNAPKRQDPKRTKKKGGKTLLSFGEEEAGNDVEPVLKKEKFNSKLVKVNDQHEPPRSVNGAGKQMQQPSRRKVSKSPSPKPALRRDSHNQLPLPIDEKPSRSASSSPEPKPVAQLSSLLERTNAQIAEMKASMKRSVPAPAPERRKKSVLEAMIPQNSTRGRKRLGGNMNPSRESVDILNAFRARLERVTDEPTSSLSANSNTDSAEFELAKANGNTAKSDEDEEGDVCNLHFIADCQSCKVWDAQLQTEADDDDKDWMSQALTFEKDRLGKDLNWKKKNEDELVVIDPREKALSIKEEERVKKRARLTGGGSRAWDKDRDRGAHARTAHSSYLIPSTVK